MKDLRDKIYGSILVAAGVIIGITLVLSYFDLFEDLRLLRTLIIVVMIVLIIFILVRWKEQLDEKYK
ncbi:hypothetical protein CEH05_08555 [Halobacillus halophilus]|uniref:Uncharacterized protein n=1 Tax=Halobacillus halophilus (strain ATCC 35676 / DSM 2266 / JCM 20832 / KCTC 3685 / LMG 17431 / NBRC 102448 / NCIMB 2269) TaxID=866895 RepID=I0JLP1_HALH3|nr:hypothetical protein [Halobacillus halophilus]ASF39166.1 hypothetical protein CEH05_08555 [Halobacillus halophilus]CCG45061.1 hypothetical protein HBHAL_2712 [Halobacillus halophilus DSM 2266]